jgi:SpoVK/Ycf46/Vps4 family AAA+-type ATPase
MANADQIRALLKSHISQDDDQFYTVMLQVAANEAQKGHRQFAIELKDIIDKYKNAPERIITSKGPIPIAQPKGELSSLLSVSYPVIRMADMVTSDTTVNRLKKVLKENRHISKIKSYGLDSRRKLLLVGPPGCGKTMSASIIAGELGIPLFSIRLDGLLNKFLGETNQKLRLVFDAIKETRGVFLFDEFDSLGSNRAFLNDVGEIKRVLNSFLIFLEQDNSNSIIVAATNFPESLDKALFRRFDDIIDFELPNQTQIRELISKRLETKIIKTTGINTLLKNMVGLNYGEIAAICNDIKKELLLEGESSIDKERVLTLVKEKSIYKQK